ncbi:MAG TPA: hypothetical protein VEK07_25135 [Polyangiaceae bacterium]|nr:hypothetical protein [Polyangiaceae bacterium]
MQFLEDMFTKERLELGAAALILGLLQKSNVPLPKLPGLGQIGTIGLVAAILGEENELADAVATACVAIAAQELGSTGAVTGASTVVGAEGGEPYYDHEASSSFVSGF